MTTLRLAYAHSASSYETALGPRPGVRPENLPALLVSYVYLDGFFLNRPHYSIRNWAMDSGAYTAWKSGEAIDLQEYTDACARLLTEDAGLVEVFALDVIGDPDAGLRNVEEMWRQGVPAIPTYHAGEPESLLLELAANYPKIAVSRSGARRMGRDELLGYLRNVFARIWPKKVHGLGFASRAMLEAVPFHSVDASTWALAPQAFGRWYSYSKTGKQDRRVSVRGLHQLRDEADWYIKLERWARARWRKQLAELEALDEQPRAGKPLANTTEAARDS